MPNDLAVKIETLEARLELMQHQIEAQQQVLAWLLAQHPQERALNFLESQANLMEENPKFAEGVALFDALSEDVRELHALRASSKDIQG